MCLVGLSSCNTFWPVQGDRFRNDTLCERAQAYDVMARATVVSAGPARELTLSPWPSSRAWYTPVVVDLERDLRGGLAAGRHSLLVGAPVANARTLATRQPTGIGNGRVGWLFASFIDAQLFMDVDGVLTSTDPERFVSPMVDESYASESDFEAALSEAIRTCPRVDLLTFDAGT